MPQKTKWSFADRWEWSRFLLLVVIMVVVVLVSVGNGLYLHYQTMLDGKRDRLSAMAKSQARFIQILHSAELARSPSAKEATTNVIALLSKNSVGWYEGLGRSGEIAFVQRAGETIRFIFRQRHFTTALPQSIPWAQTTQGLPSRLALEGGSGVIVGHDYRGVEVLAAYEYLPSLALGLVVKMDLEELRQPLWNTAIYTLLTALLAVVVASLLFSRIVEGVIRRLWETRQDLAITLQSIGDGVLVTDAAGCVVQMNPVAEQLTGWPLAEAKTRPLNEVFSIINIQTRRTMENPAILAIKSGQIVGMADDTCLLARDGIERQIADSGAPIFNHQGALRGAVLVFRDVTEACRIRQDLVNNERRYYDLFENIGICVAVFSTPDEGHSFVFQAFNRAAEMVDHLRREEVLGQDLTQVFPGVEKFGLLKVFRQVWRTGEPLYFPLSFYNDHRLAGWRENYVYKLNSGEVVTAYRDLTEQRRTENALRLRDEILRHMAEGVALVKSDDGTIVYTNPEFECMFGYETDGLLGKNISIINAPTEKSPEETAKLISEALNRDGFWQGEICNITRQGDHVRSHATVSSLDHPTYGRVWVTIHQDISERKQAEEALKESEQTYRSLFENMLNGFAYCQVLFENDEPRDFVYLKVNTAFERQTGLQHVVGRKVSEVIPGFCENDTRLLANFGRVARTGQQEQFEIYVQALSSWFFISVYCPAPEHFVAVFDNITERKNAENALMEEIVRRRALFEHSRDGLCVFDSNGLVKEANVKFASMLGFSMDEVTSLHLWDWDVQWKQEEILPMLQDIGSEGSTFTTKHRRKDGSFYDVEVNTCRVEFQGSSLILASHRDISQQLNQEAQIRQSMKLEAIGTLTGGIAHDFNNILGVILGFSELVLKRLPKGEQPYLDLQEIYKAGLRARELVAQLLTFSRRSEKHAQPLLLEPLVKEVMKFLKAVIPASIETTLHINTRTAKVMGDSTEIHQILMNLCTNAIQAMENTKGRLTVTLEEVTLEEQTARPLPLLPGPHILLTVSDTGPGILPEILPRIFDPFFTTKGIGQGTGLGLSVVHGLTMAIGGAIRVQSLPGEGTHFQVYLPALQEELPQSDVDLPVDATRFDLRVLVVDDDDSLAEMTRKQLAELGCRVTTLTNPKTAMTLLHSQPTGFDLVITDLTMPHASGIDLQQFIEELNPSLPVVLTSGHLVDTTSQEVELQGFRAFLRKPVLISDLVRVLRQLETEK